MSRFRNIVESIIYNSNILFESEQKINWILSQPKLVQALENRIQNDSKTPNNITAKQLLKNFDNSSIVIGKFLPWVVKMYSNNEFEYTDLGLINNYLGSFVKNSNKLEKKDINQYKSLEELNNALENIKDVKGSREVQRDAKSGAEKIYEDNKWIILIPHTKEAAIQYGKNTKWCTAGINNNMFDYYNEDGPLYILINKQNPNEKYQFHFETNQYKDVEDREIDLKSFLEENPEIKIFFASIKNLDKTDIKNWIWLNGTKLNYNDYFEEVKKHGFVLKYVPEEVKDYKMCLEAIKQAGYRLEFVPEKLKDYNMCLIAVKSKATALKYVPEEFKDYKLCLEAVKSGGYMLIDVPEEFKDYKLCLTAVKSDGCAIVDVPEELKDYNMYLEAVKSDGYTLECIPEEFKDYQMCLEAVKSKGEALKYVPEELKDYRMCLTAIKKNNSALNYTSKQFKEKLKQKIGI